ncbi:MAG: phycobilisome linker polypeptide [Phormidesmis sp.]
MNVLSQSDTSDYQNRTVTIEVTGARQQSVMKQSSYQIRVPYSQMSQTMQTIHRRGDRIASVAVVGAVEENSPASSSRASTSNASPQSEQGAKSEASKDQDQDQKTKNKRR